MGEDGAGDLGALVEMSRAYGADPEMVLGGGGNTSVKSNGHLMVKVSGASLSEIGPEDFVDLDRAALQCLLEVELPTSRVEREAAFKEALLRARLSEAGAHRPSVESVLHHLMPGKFVAHLHATAVNQFACSRNGRALIEEHLGGSVVWVGLVDPGFPLAKELQQRLRAFSARTGTERPRAVVMQNHGVVVSGESPSEARAHLDWLLGQLSGIKARFRAEVLAAAGPPGKVFPPAARPRPAGEVARTAAIVSSAPVSSAPVSSAPVSSALVSSALADVVATTGQGPPEVVFDGSDVVADLVTRPDGRHLALGGPLTPDQIVYCLSFPLWVSPGGGGAGDALTQEHLEAELRRYTNEYGVLPRVVLVEGEGMFTWGPTRPEAETVRLVYRDAVKVMTGALDLGGVNYLDEDFRTFIENWELESYRRKRLFQTP